jgi:cell division protein FtsB
VSLRRLFFTLYIAFLAGLSVLIAITFHNAYEQLRELRETERADRLRLDQAEARLRQQEVVLARLRTDPGYVERVIRRELGYAKPGETIFRFEDNAHEP